MIQAEDAQVMTLIAEKQRDLTLDITKTILKILTVDQREQHLRLLAQAIIFSIIDDKIHCAARMCTHNVKAVVYTSHLGSSMQKYYIGLNEKAVDFVVNEIAEILKASGYKNVIGKWDTVIDVDAESVYEIKYFEISFDWEDVQIPIPIV
jgi:hypothetical protein